MSGTITFDLVGYERCADELIAFRNANRTIHRDRRYFDWRYKLRPCSLSAFVVWARLDGLPVGAVSVFPHDYFVGEGEYPIGVIGDVSVSTELRGRGLAAEIIGHVNTALAERGLRGGLVLPTPAAARAFAKAGWSDSGQIDRYVKQLNFTRRASAIIGSPLIAGIVVAPINLALRILDQGFGTALEGWSSRESAGFGEPFDDLWATVPKRGRFLGVRRMPYLRWRFETHPVTKYRVMEVVREHQLHGYIVYRIETGTCYVDDLLVEGDRCVPVALGLLVQHLRERERDCDRVSVSVSCWWGDGKAWRYGFLRRPDFQRVMTWNLNPGADSLRIQLMPADKDV